MHPQQNTNKQKIAQLGLSAFLLFLAVGLHGQCELRRLVGNAAYSGPRIHTWKLTADTWNSGQSVGLSTDGGVLELSSSVNAGVFVSEIGQSPFDFSGVGIHLNAAWPPGSQISFELRLRPAGGEWSAWQVLDEFSSETDGRFYSDDLIFPTSGSARQIQIRLNLKAAPYGSSPRLRDLSLVAIDAHSGPNAAQALSAAQARQISTPQGGLSQPLIITRADWGADEDWMSWPPEYVPVEKVILHHTVSGGTGDPAVEMRTIYYYHAITRGWGDIGYNFVIDPNGNVYQGRAGGLDIVGAHAAYWNDASLGVSVLGCYHSSSCSPTMYPSQATLDALADLLAWQASRRLIDPLGQSWFESPYINQSYYNYHIAGHRDYGSTACPGDYLYAKLPNIRQAAWERLPDYDVRFDNLDIPATLQAGQQLNIHANLHNAGRLTWQQSAGINLGYRWYAQGALVQENKTAALVTTDVLLGEMTTLAVELAAPTQGGDYTLVWDLYQEGVGWFSDQAPPQGRSQALEISIAVGAPLPTLTPTPPPAATLQIHARIAPSAVHSGSIARYYLDVQGPDGLPFETYTLLPNGIVYAPSGVWGPHLSQVEWNGVFYNETAQNDFLLLVSSDLTESMALTFSSTLNTEGLSPTWAQTRLIVNGYSLFLAVVSKPRLPAAPEPTPTTVPATPAPDPTPTALPASCYDLLVNGSFETQQDWSINSTSFPAAYSNERSQAGSWSMRLGVPPGSANTYSFSSVDQTVSIPNNATSVDLSYSLYPLSSDLAGDWFDLLLQEQNGWRELRKQQSNAQEWQPAAFDLAAYTGQTVTLRFRVYNDGRAGQATAWLDQVVLWVCVP